MPNLDFYAVGSDQAAVLDVVFRLGVFRVFEAYSEPDRELREFTSADVPHDPYGRHLTLFPVGAGPAPVIRRIDLRHRAVGDATFRYECAGWGMIQLLFGVHHQQRLDLSHTNHNTEKRAATWAGVYADRLGDPGDWDWKEVTRQSGRVNRAIRALAVDKIGSHPVLPAAAELIARAGLDLERGRGIPASAEEKRGTLHHLGDRPT